MFRMTFIVIKDIKKYQLSEGNEISITYVNKKMFFRNDSKDMKTFVEVDNNDRDFFKENIIYIDDYFNHQ